MPSLDEILKDTLIKIAAKNADAGALKEFEPGTMTLSPRPSPGLSLLPQPVWFWEYTGVTPINPDVAMNHVAELEVWSRSVTAMHGNDVSKGWMTVASPVHWGPVTVHLPHEQLDLPLTQKYFIKGLTIGSGSNPGGASPGGNAWWPLKADFDQSFASVFAYDLTTREQNKPPGTVDPAIVNSATFMPDPNVDGTDLPLETTGNVAVADRHFICVVLSLVCMRERPDFEPVGIIGMGRFYPHFMIMSNRRIAGEHLGMSATINITRPDRSGYHGSFSNPGGPRIMQHPDMDPAILPLLTTEPNVIRGADITNLLVLPYWDLMFDYFLPIDYRAGTGGTLPRHQKTAVVDRTRTARRTIKGAVQHLDYSKMFSKAVAALAHPMVLPIIPLPIRTAGAIVATAVLSRPSLQSVMFGVARQILNLGAITKSQFEPRVSPAIVKVPGQGTFDNLHISPRMKAHKVIGTPEMSAAQAPKWQASLDTLETIRMAPFCEHDCMHTHWRWGEAFRLAPNSGALGGFAAADASEKQFTGTGKPYQSVGSAMVPLNQSIDIAMRSNQQLEYVAAIASLAPGVWQPVFHHGSAYVLGFSALGTVAYGGIKLTVGGSVEASELYWNMRFQAAEDGPLERVEQSAADLHRAMTASNTVRLHLKVFAEPALASIEKMLVNAKALFDLHGLDVVEVSRETMAEDGTEFSRFQTLKIDPAVPTDEQTDLFNLRGVAEPDDLVIYFVRTMVPAQAGCATHPPDKPGAIVCAALAGEWTLAHQIGHVLGLDHVNGVDRLMTGRSTDSIEAAIPEIAEDEVATIMGSAFNKV